MTGTASLAVSSRLRFATGAIMYFAQGVPMGLLHVAIPAWLASQEVPAKEIATYLALIVLPWAFKVLSGPFMDRFQFPAMGRRRPWVLGAQLGLTLAFFALTFVDITGSQVGLLTVAGILINAFAATQDVAVDGMSIDLTPLDEQGRLNAYMASGKAIGGAAFAAISGTLLVVGGLPAAAFAAGVASAAVFVYFVFVLEREGERRLPWSRGSVMSETPPAHSLIGLLRDLRGALFARASLVLMAIMVFDGLIHGYGHALMPIAAVQVFGYTTPEWSNLVATMGLVGALIALGFGPLIDRFGPKRMLIVTVLVVGLHAFLLAETQYLWENTVYVRGMLSAWIMLGPITMVCMIALGMTLCSSVNSATQFAVYMSLANLGSSIGARAYGTVAEHSSYVEAYLTLGGLTVVLLFIVFLHQHRHPSRGDSGRKQPPRYTIGQSTGGAGIFFSGAIRCPKCRADMETVVVDGTEVDRCRSCKGLWFDEGELEKLKDAGVAAELDIGDASTGRSQNTNDRYRCPRCAGPMIRMVDAEQTHIWFERCSDCRGSYFDAGEFTDLSTRSIGDLFRKVLTPERR